MGHKNRLTLVGQVTQELRAQYTEGKGRDKHADKVADAMTGRIYSYNTLKTYIKHCCYFVNWCKSEHGCKTLDECKPYVSEWMSTRSNLSAWTQKLEASALAKIYRVSQSELGIETPERKRTEVKRSRGEAVRDKHFSVTKNAELVNFAKSTGLRRRELTQIRGDAVFRDGGRWYLRVDEGTKGGRVRIAPIMGTEDEIRAVVQKCQSAGKNAVWGRRGVPGTMDVHACRKEYAQRVYSASALPAIGKEAYKCRGDMHGIVYSRTGLSAASEALGHGRLQVVVSNYSPAP